MENFSKAQLDDLLLMANQLFALKGKVSHDRSLYRHVERMERALASLGLLIHDPLGEPYDETRTDCEASIAGESVHNLVVVEVIKPIVYQQAGTWRQLLQPGVVVVQGRPSHA